MEIKTQKFDVLIINIFHEVGMYTYYLRTCVDGNLLYVTLRTCS